MQLRKMGLANCLFFKASLNKMICESACQFWQLHLFRQVHPAGYLTLDSKVPVLLLAKTPFQTAVSSHAPHFQIT